ncbi:MAG: phosphodiester glycosidase family protein [Polyangiales bacterium]
MRVATLALLLFASDGLAQVRYARRVVRFHDRPSTVHALTVDLCDPRVSLRVTSPAEGPAQVSQWARRVGAFAAINGDYFDPQTLAPLGVARGAGVSWPTPPRAHRDALLAVDARGAVSVLDAVDDLAAVPAAQREVLALREQVLRDGVVRESEAIRGHDARHPRTGLGLSADRRTLYLVVVEGRSERDSGVTARQLGEVLRGLGARDGFKLDGGGSSTLFVRGRGVMNRPSDGRERVVATHLGVLVGGSRGPSRCR